MFYIGAMRMSGAETVNVRPYVHKHNGVTSLVRNAGKSVVVRVCDGWATARAPHSPPSVYNGVFMPHFWLFVPCCYLPTTTPTGWILANLFHFLLLLLFLLLLVPLVVVTRPSTLLQRVVAAAGRQWERQRRLAQTILRHHAS
jgi:hypothetical protein